MHTLTKKEFDELAEVKYSSGVSIYLPTHRSGKEVLNEEDRILFKNQLKAVRQKFEERGWGEKNIKELLQPAKELLEDSTFWRNRTKGLSIFLAGDFSKYYDLPYSVEPYYHISRGFYLRPLVPSFSGNGKFYALGLNLHHITLYEGDREKLEEIYVGNFTPQRMEEVVGYDYKERFLQFRSQQEGHGQASFHGHGEWKGEFKKEEILKFFREVDKKLGQLIGGKNIPLFVIGQEYLFGIYKKINTYRHLVDGYLDLNPEHLDIEDMHHKIWQELYPKYDKERVEKTKLIKQLHNTPRASFDLEDIVPAAANGKVDTLFVQKEAEVWGIFDKKNNAIIIEEEQSISNTSLLNLAVVEVLRHGGKVYEQTSETMPVPYAEINALYRY